MSKPLVVITFCLRRLPTLTVEAFADYWKNHHGPLAAKHMPALGAVRYAQLHTVPHALNGEKGLSRGGPAAFDGFAQVHFKSIEHLIAGMSTEAGRTAGRELVRDERKFIDFTQSSIALGEEHLMFEANAQALASP